MVYYPGAALTVQAATPVAGVSLVNGTPVLLTWNVPNDGAQHRVMVFMSETSVAAMTGGEVLATATAPDGTAFNLYSITPAGGAGFNTNGFGFQAIVEPGSVVEVIQFSALTAGGPAKLWAEIWGS